MLVKTDTMARRVSGALGLATSTRGHAEVAAAGAECTSAHMFARVGHAECDRGRWFGSGACAA
jgi:hypothetical protein